MMLALIGGSLSAQFRFPEGWDGNIDERKAHKHYTKSILLVENNHLYEAVDELGKAIDANPFEVEYWDFMVDIALAMKKKDYEPRLKYLQVALGKKLRNAQKQFPEDGNFEYAYLRLQSFQRYIFKDKLLKLLKKYPDHEYARAKYAELYYYKYKNKRNLKRAKKIINKRMKMNPSWMKGWKMINPKVAFLLGDNRPSYHCLNMFNSDLDGKILMNHKSWFLHVFLDKGCPVSCGFWVVASYNRLFKDGTIYKQYPAEAEGYYRMWTRFSRLVKAKRLCTGGMHRKDGPLLEKLHQDALKQRDNRAFTNVKDNDIIN